ncbi:MAG: hypothetical protein ACRBFS_23165 [Aureispira sp.]
MNKILYFCLVVFLLACETLPSTSDKEIVVVKENIPLQEETLETRVILDTSIAIKDKIVPLDWESYPIGLWIGKSYYDSLVNGTLTTLFINNYLVTEWGEEEDAAILHFGNARSGFNGRVFIKKEKIHYHSPVERYDLEGDFTITQKGTQQLLSLSKYEGLSEQEEFIKDSVYIKVGEDKGIYRYNGFNCVRHPVENLYFNGSYEAMDKKTSKVYGTVIIEEGKIKNFVGEVDLLYQYESIFSGEDVLCLAMQNSWTKPDLDATKRRYYRPSERQYFIIEDTTDGFLLYELLQPDLEHPKGCVEADDIESEAVKGELCYVFTRKKRKEHKPSYKQYKNFVEQPSIEALTFEELSTHNRVITTPFYFRRNEHKKETLLMPTMALDNGRIAPVKLSTPIMEKIATKAAFYENKVIELYFQVDLKNGYKNYYALINTWKEDKITFQSRAILSFSADGELISSLEPCEDFLVMDNQIISTWYYASDPDPTYEVWIQDDLGRFEKIKSSSKLPEKLRKFGEQIK